MADLFLNLDYPRVQQEPIRTLSTVRINPRVESVLINSHSIRDIGLLANYKHIQTIKLAHLQLDTSLSELLSFLGNADKFPMVREISIENVVFQAKEEEQALLKERSSLSPSVRRRYSHIRKLTISGVFIPGKTPIQAFITMASGALNALTLCELRLDLQSQANSSDTTHTDLAHIVGLLIAFPNLQTYNAIQITDQLQNLSRSRTAELLLSMRARLQDAKGLLEETILQLNKRGETIKSLRDALGEVKHEKERLEEEILSLSATCATLKSSNLRLSQSNDLLDYLGTNVQTFCSTHQLELSGTTVPLKLTDSSPSSTSLAQKQQQLYSSVVATTQTDSELSVSSVSRAVAAQPSRPMLSCQDSLQDSHPLHLLDECPKHSADEVSSTFRLLSESIALARAEIQCNRIGMVTEDLYSQFNQKIRQKNDEIKILVDALVQVHNEEEQPNSQNKAELIRARRVISNLTEEIEQLRNTVGTTQENLQEVIAERDDLAINLSRLEKELASTIENHQIELAGIRESAMAEAEMTINGKMMEANAHIRLLEDNIVSMTDQIKLQEAELAVIEEGYCKKCMLASLTRFEVSRPPEEDIHTTSYAATQTDKTTNSVSTACQHSMATSNKAVHTIPMLTTTLIKNSVVCQTSCDSSEFVPLQCHLPQSTIHTANCGVQTDICPELGPTELISSVLQAPQLEEALRETKQQCNELKAECAAREHELKALLQKHQKLNDYNQKLATECKKLNVELSRQRIKSSSPRASSTIEIDNFNVEKTKLLLDLNRALQQRDAYKQNLKKAIVYVTKLMSLRTHNVEALTQGEKKCKLPTSKGEMGKHDVYEQRISKLQHQVRQLAKHKSEQTKYAEAIIGKQDMMQHHSLCPRRARSEHATMCSPAMSQELIESLEELAKRVDAMLPDKRGSKV
ncbi:Hypothetical protein GLP15_412 [Giardia lamblia P15]|uniref:Coiled-coil protein n=1 Tax=Giardia intestinalis (strain P15) TaxID=658858 RepID=E1EXF8_GIAIA|nr:Hypothetical protein GLP15_412 [Giardia lamblia P15]